ncbi:hypothetical protein GPA10_22335 [Streptomyces sp. p1417]|uniref:Uncharacterized protein n=1 Tax=Streptomyces typhae TaxID=2681492 RepID=A0A6L6X0W7_9ACTN|nr:hypothetical protein [Streptomyces typhae]MVO87424.1 hypothetical protein [Streptomyces typhae]
MRKFPSELEADLLQFFGIDFLDLWRGQLSLRRINVLIESLLNQPGRSTLAAAIDESAEWSESDYILARISDAVELSNWMYYQANSGEGSEEIDAPAPLPRPGRAHEALATEPASYASTDEVVDFFNRMNNI